MSSESLKKFLPAFPGLVQSLDTGLIVHWTWSSSCKVDSSTKLPVVEASSRLLQQQYNDNVATVLVNIVVVYVMQVTVLLLYYCCYYYYYYHNY